MASLLTTPVLSWPLNVGEGTALQESLRNEIIRSTMVPTSLLGNALIGSTRVPTSLPAEQGKNKKQDLLYMRGDCPRLTHFRTKRTNMYREFYRTEVALHFDDLHLTFPLPSEDNTYRTLPLTRMETNIIGEILDLESPLQSRRELIFSFNKVGNDKQILCIAGIPALVFVAINGFIPSRGETQEIHLYKILPVNNSGYEKLKRLFLRHMGFNCIRHKNMLKIKFRSDEVIIKPKEEYTFINKFVDTFGEATNIRTNGFTKISVTARKWK